MLDETGTEGGNEMADWAARLRDEAMRRVIAEGSLRFHSSKDGYLDLSLALPTVLYQGIAVDPNTLTQQGRCILLGLQRLAYATARHELRRKTLMRGRCANTGIVVHVWSEIYHWAWSIHFPSVQGPYKPTFEMTYINVTADEAYRQAIRVALLQGAEYDIKPGMMVFPPLEAVPDPFPDGSPTPAV